MWKAAAFCYKFLRNQKFKFSSTYPICSHGQVQCNSLREGLIMKKVTMAQVNIFIEKKRELMDQGGKGWQMEHNHAQLCCYFEVCFFLILFFVRINRKKIYLFEEVNYRHKRCYVQSRQSSSKNGTVKVWTRLKKTSLCYCAYLVPGLSYWLYK